MSTKTTRLLALRARHWSGITTGVNNGNPSTVAAWDANITAANTLTITNTGGAWDGLNDGPFLWKTVNGSGDFTNTVHVSRMDQINYHFAGLLVRNPNSLSNWVNIGLFPEFGVEIDVRDTIDGASTEHVSTGAGYVETNSVTWRSWLQITRVGGVIATYASTDGVTWELTYQSARTDLTGDLQVGIFDATYTGNQCSAQHQNFSIVGPGVNINTPPSPATGLTVTPQTGSLNIAWANGAGSAGSVVVVRRANPITYQPLDGSTYTGSGTFGSGSDLGESNYVAYAGSGTSVTLTNVTPLIPYTVAVYAYSGAGASTVYALSNAPASTQAPLGTPTGIAVTFVSTNAVAVDDNIQAIVTLYFAGGSQIDVTTSSTFGSGNASLASVSASGLASGLSNGVVAITASYQTFSASSNLTVVKVPVTDDFSTAHNYLTQGVVGTYWSGVMLSTNDLDLSLGQASSGPTTTLFANAGITQVGKLSVATHDSGFGVGSDAGFFLYRIVDGDFSIAIQIPSFQSDTGTNAYHMPGLMARAPYELAYTENFLQWIGFNEFSIGNFSRRSINGSYAETDFNPSPAMPFIMITRQTNTFGFYQKAHALDAWTLVGSEDHPEYAGVPMQVGIVDQTFTANTASSLFDNLLLVVPGGLTNSVNAPSAATALTLTNPAASKVSAGWTAGAGSSGSIVIAHPDSGVTRQPANGNDFSSTASADFTVGQNLGASNIVVYAGSGTSVVVSNVPSALCYFSVYSYKTVAGTNYYNLSNPATGSINLAPTPPAVTVGITNAGNGVFQLAWPQGTLLEATNVVGPWTTNLAASPYFITNPVGNKFFRVQVQ